MHTTNHYGHRHISWTLKILIMASVLLRMNYEDEIAPNTQALYGRSIAERKTGIMDLPPEIRAIFIRAVLGDRKVHAHYPENVGHPMLKD